MAVDIFKNSTKSLPTSDPQIVRVDMEQLDIGGRKSHLPNQSKNDITIEHVPSQGGRTGSGR